MARLRIRIELNRGDLGVPLEKLARIADEAHRFFRMLGEDVHLDQKRGEWLALDFDRKSLHFTAEYAGPADAVQVRAFHAAFDGVTLLRRATITQFARIADALEEDELIGFGLYQSDQEVEPSEWRCLSKRNALRICEEIRMLLDSCEADEQESRLPAALDAGVSASLFKERHERSPGKGPLAEFEQRMAHVEGRLHEHSEAISELRGKTVGTEQSLQKLLTAVEDFCDRASKQLTAGPPVTAPPAQLPPGPPSGARRRRWPIAAAVAGIAVLAAFRYSWGVFVPRPAPARAEAAPPAKPHAPPVETPKLVQAPKPPDAVAPVRVELKVLETSWVAAQADGKTVFARLLDTDHTRMLEAAQSARVRVGNAGGIEITWNGKALGAIGERGEVRTVEFTRDKYRILPPSVPAVKQAEP